jgi:hypothetical protein
LKVISAKKVSEDFQKATLKLKGIKIFAEIMHTLEQVGEPNNFFSSSYKKAGSHGFNPVRLLTLI